LLIDREPVLLLVVIGMFTTFILLLTTFIPPPPDTLKNVRCALLSAGYNVQAVTTRLGFPSSLPVSAVLVNFNNNNNNNNIFPPTPPSTPLDAIIALFSLSQSIEFLPSLSNLKKSLLDSNFVVANTDTTFSPTVLITPFATNNGHDLLFITDLHPSVSKTCENSVMYVGPDTVACAKHVSQQAPPPASILDLCCGCGVQGFVAYFQNLVSDFPPPSLTFVDVNERCLQFTKMNAVMNQIDSQIVTVGHDLSSVHPLPLEGLFDLILANPPYVPTPPNLRSRNGLYVDGGENGERLLKLVIQAVSLHLDSDGLAIIVSEFMNPESFENIMSSWWSTAGESPNSFSAKFCTNKKTLTAASYSQKRGGEGDAAAWLSHLNTLSIEQIVVGLLFLRRTETRNFERVVCDGLFAPYRANNIKKLGKF